MIVILFLLGIVSAQCPDSVANEAELISLSVDCFRQLYDHKSFDNMKLQKIVTDRLHNYQRMLQQLTMSGKQHLRTTPVVKWAQNNNQLFISFKLSHRQDSPTCSDIRDESFKTQNIVESQGDISFENSFSQTENISSFSYQGQCFFTTQKFMFTLMISFEKNVKKLSLKKAGFGLYTLVADKEEEGIWIQPFTDFKKAAIWPQLRHKYQKDMNFYFELTDNNSDNTLAKRRKRRRPKNSNENQL